MGPVHIGGVSRVVVKGKLDGAALCRGQDRALLV